MTINSQEFYTELTLNQMLDKCWEYNITCIDLRQANDSVRPKKKKEREALQHFQIPNKMIILVKTIVDDTVAKVQVQTVMTELFEIRDGRQHCHSVL
jgi:hypothetical protein